MYRINAIGCNGICNISNNMVSIYRKRTQELCCADLKHFAKNNSVWLQRLQIRNVCFEGKSKAILQSAVGGSDIPVACPRSQAALLKGRAKADPCSQATISARVLVVNIRWTVKRGCT